jgi:hypothetical protein
VCDFKANCLYHGKFLEVHFSKIVAPHNKFYVEVFNDNILVASLEMGVDKNGIWNLLPPSPQWTLEIKDELARTIADFCQ